jgi:protein-S-isoprenylcysteine O-methyltransferase Ste14
MPAMPDAPNPDNSSAPKPALPPTDYRARRRRDDRALFLAVIAVLLGVGGGLIFLIYGASALITGLACLLVGAGLLALLWLIMTGIERWANR